MLVVSFFSCKRMEQNICYFEFLITLILSFQNGKIQIYSTRSGTLINILEKTQAINFGSFSNISLQAPFSFNFPWFLQTNLAAESNNGIMGSNNEFGIYESLSEHLSKFLFQLAKWKRTKLWTNKTFIFFFNYSN